MESSYTFQSFYFRGRDRLRPYYDLISNIAAEEFTRCDSGWAKLPELLDEPQLTAPLGPEMDPEMFKNVASQLFGKSKS